MAQQVARVCLLTILLYMVWASLWWLSLLCAWGHQAVIKVSIVNIFGGAGSSINGVVLRASTGRPTSTAGDLGKKSRVRRVLKIKKDFKIPRLSLERCECFMHPRIRLAVGINQNKRNNQFYTPYTYAGETSCCCQHAYNKRRTGRRKKKSRDLRVASAGTW